MYDTLDKIPSASVKLFNKNVVKPFFLNDSRFMRRDIWQLINFHVYHMNYQFPNNETRLIPSSAK